MGSQVSPDRAPVNQSEFGECNSRPHTSITSLQLHLQQFLLSGFDTLACAVTALVMIFGTHSSSLLNQPAYAPHPAAAPEASCFTPVGQILGLTTAAHRFEEEVELVGSGEFPPVNSLQTVPCDV